MTIGQSTMAPASMLVVTQTVPVCTATRGRYLGQPTQFFGPLQGYQPTLSPSPRRTLRVPAQLWTLALASDLRSSLAVYFLDHGRLLAADGPSTSSYAANALLPMSVPVSTRRLGDVSSPDQCDNNFNNINAWQFTT